MSQVNNLNGKVLRLLLKYFKAHLTHKKNHMKHWQLKPGCDKEKYSESTCCEQHKALSRSWQQVKSLQLALDLLFEIGGYAYVEECKFKVGSGAEKRTSPQIGSDRWLNDLKQKTRKLFAQDIFPEELFRH